MPYDVCYAPAARRRLHKIDEAAQRQLVTEIDHLADEPRPRPPGCRKLKGHKSIYRIRVGDLRVVYQVEGDKVLVLVVGHRRDVYDDLERLLTR